jgi:hypothetical protein
MILLLLAPPAQRLRVRVVQAVVLRRRLEHDGRSGWSARRGGSAARAVLSPSCDAMRPKGSAASVSLRRLAFCLILLKFIIITVCSLKLCEWVF